MTELQCPDCSEVGSLFENPKYGDLECSVCSGAFEWEQVSSFNNTEISELEESI